MAGYTSPFIWVSRSGSRSAGTEAEPAVVWLRGEHDIATRVAVAVAIASAAQRHDAGVAVDLSGVTFMDASTVGAIVGSRNRLRARSQALELRSPSPPALRVIELCGLDHLIAPEAADPAGVGSALGSWVEVPLAPPISDMANAAADPALPDVRQRTRAMRLSTIDEVGVTIEADRSKA